MFSQKVGKTRESIAYTDTLKSDFPVYFLNSHKIKASHGPNKSRPADLLVQKLRMRSFYKDSLESVLQIWYLHAGLPPREDEGRKIHPSQAP